MSKPPKAFLFTNTLGLSQAFNPLDLYASVSTVEILSSHGFPGCSLCSCTDSLSHLLTTLFVCLHPLGWHQLLRFKTWLSAFPPQYPPRTEYILNCPYAGSSKMHEQVLTSPTVVLSTVTSWSLSSDSWLLKGKKSEIKLICPQPYRHS